MTPAAVRTPVLARDREALAAARVAATGPVAVVMTLGALHPGHLALLEAARRRAATVLTTIFVNPLQFGPGEDYDRYPRTFEEDLAVCGDAGVDLVFAPSREEIYRYGDPQVLVHPGPLGEVLEGASRSGHFAGVLTVVHKLLQLTRPDLACFGEKDYQQLTLIQRMVRDLDLPVEIMPVPTVREPDGLALSSRNRYLSTADRRAARSLPAALRAAEAAAAAGADPRAVLAAAAGPLTGAPGVALDYLALTDPALRPLTPAIGTDLPGRPARVPPDGAARLLLAARVGGTRLIDNAQIQFSRGDQ